MPFIAIKVFERELSAAQTASVIHDVTEAVMPFVGDGLRDSTWVVVEELRAARGASAERPSVSTMSGPFRPNPARRLRNDGAGRSHVYRAESTRHGIGARNRQGDRMAVRARMQGSIVDVDGGQNKGV